MYYIFARIYVYLKKIQFLFFINNDHPNSAKIYTRSFTHAYQFRKNRTN